MPRYKSRFEPGRPHMEPLRIYHGTVSERLFKQVPAYYFVPQGSGHLRMHTVRNYQAPYRATWWIYVSGDMRPGGTNGSANMDGLHTHFHHLNNDVNYNIHSVRRDGHAKLDFENGQQGYQSQGWKGHQGLPLRLWRTYTFTLDVSDQYANIKVANDDQRDEAISLEWNLGQFNPAGGHLGWRLDNLTGYLGGITIKEL